MPKSPPDDQDRYFLEYEMRYNFQTNAIGAPLKIVIMTMDEESRYYETTPHSQRNEI